MTDKQGQVYILGSSTTGAGWELSHKAASLLFPMYCNIDDLNQLDKTDFESRVGWVKDSRTWKKYWDELIEKEVVIFLDQYTIMLTPKECYRVGVNHKALLDR